MKTCLCARRAGKIGSPGGYRDGNSLLCSRKLLHRERYGRIRHIHDHAHIAVAKPSTDDAGGYVDLVLVIVGKHLDLASKHLLAEILNRHLSGYKRPLATEVLVGAAHVGQHTDVDVLYLARDTGTTCQDPARQKHDDGRDRNLPCFDWIGHHRSSLGVLRIIS